VLPLNSGLIKLTGKGLRAFEFFENYSKPQTLLPLNSVPLNLHNSIN
jgi:hypothetical protein